MKKERLEEETMELNANNINYLDYKKIRKLGYSIWCAKYSDSKPRKEIDYDIWQYTNKGLLEGIEGYVDLNIMEKDIRGSEINNKKKSNFTHNTTHMITYTPLPQTHTPPRKMYFKLSYKYQIKN